MNRLKKVLTSSKKPQFTQPFVKVVEPTSFANFDNVVVNHMKLSLQPDFERKVVGGSVVFLAEYQYTPPKHADPSSKAFEMILDTRDLKVSSVSFLPSRSKRKSSMGFFTDKKPKDAVEVGFELGKKHESFGTPLHIKFPDSFAQEIKAEGKKTKTTVKRSFSLQVAYETAPAGVCTAIQWLEKEQTKDQLGPFLFTQCQAIHCRSMVPCQDAPACKTTYSATVTVPSSSRALMSAPSTGEEQLEGGLTRYSFDQSVPMPPYLIALVVGVLECREVGPRTDVWAEPSMVEASASEFAETEKYLAAAEEICGEYVWGRYDLLVLPPSFPYGGMENPCLTFVTPTLLAGDRSLTNVVAHEIAHSWMGNLVTNATWEDFWMNEGFTVWVERRIISRVFGEDRSALQSAIGWSELAKTVKEIGPEHPFTQLHIPMDGIDPDDSFSSIPYEKGYAFLCYLEELVGGPSAFEPFIKAHVSQFQFNTVNVKEWKSFFIDYFRKTIPPSTLNKIAWDAWIYEPGMPPIEKPDFNSSLMKTCVASADEWVKKGKSGSVSKANATKWSTEERVVFLEHILSKVSSGDDKAKKTLIKAISALDQVHGFSQTKNAEVRFLWNTLGLKLGQEAFFDDSVAFLTDQGRMKFVRPLYKDLAACGDKGKKLAHATFKEHEMSYHSIARKMVAKDLGLSA